MAEITGAGGTPVKKRKTPSLGDLVYRRIKDDLNKFELLPGDRFTETEVASLTGASRTPVREALIRLEKEGYLQMKPKAGWMVKPIDFRRLEELYDLRILLETDAVLKFCQLPEAPDHLKELQRFWQTPGWERPQDGEVVFQADEGFHETLVALGGNREITRLHKDITEKIRLVRKLDFTAQERIDTTYREHAAILEALSRRDGPTAVQLLKTHIILSRAGVKALTLQKLELARHRRQDGRSLVQEG